MNRPPSAHDITRTVLTDARALLAEGKWTRGAMARNADGSMVEPEDPKACRFCALGAIRHAGGRRFGFAWPLTATNAALIPALPREAIGSVICFNDAPGRQLDEVVAVFDRALAGLDAPAQQAA